MKGQWTPAKRDCHLEKIRAMNQHLRAPGRQWVSLQTAQRPWSLTAGETLGTGGLRAAGLVGLDPSPHPAGHYANVRPWMGKNWDLLEDTWSYGQWPVARLGGEGPETRAVNALTHVSVQHTLHLTML